MSSATTRHRRPPCSAVQSQQFADRLLRLFGRQALSAKEDPFRDELREWVFGREDFLRRLAALAEGGHLQKGRANLRTVPAVFTTHRPAAAFAA